MDGAFSHFSQGTVNSSQRVAWKVIALYLCRERLGLFLDPVLAPLRRSGEATLSSTGLTHPSPRPPQKLPFVTLGISPPTPGSYLKCERLKGV